MLSGLKTYITAILAIGVAVLAYLAGQISVFDTVTAIGLATGLFGARSVMHAVDIILIVKDPKRMGMSAAARQWITYLGVGIAIVSAVTAFLVGVTDLSATITAIFAALGINFLSIGAKSTAEDITMS